MGGKTTVLATLTTGVGDGSGKGSGMEGMERRGGRQLVVGEATVARIVNAELTLTKHSFLQTCT